VEPVEQEPPRKKRIQTLKFSSRDPVQLSLPSKVRDVVPLALATNVAPKLQMSPPPVRRKMKATGPLSQLEHALCVEHVLSSTLHSEARSSTKEQSPDSIDVSLSIEEVEFRVVNHASVLQVSPTTTTREDVEIQAWNNVTLLFHQAIKISPPKVENNDLYVLNTETIDNWVL
jgi:hypothetical protein